MHYTQLQQLYLKYKQQGFEVLAFPSNQFGKQEPGSPAEITSFVQRFDVTFQMFAKCNVNGKHQHPVFAFAKKQLPSIAGTSIKWNWTKFLVDRQGQVRHRFSPITSPNSMVSAIDTLLQEQV
jgi:glutathione peroxidase